MTLTLLLLIIPVFGSIVGLIGKSWDDTKTSRIKLTPRGWTSFTIILIGLGFTAYKAIQTQNENERLKEQRNNVRKLAYDKLYYDCIAAIEPLTTLYLENSKQHAKRSIDDEYNLCVEMMSDRAQRVFKDCNLLDSVKEGTAFDAWDKSYADYIHGYYNSKYPYSMEQTMTRWANYIDMDDLVLIDTIINHSYWTTLQNINYGQTEKERNEFIKKVGVFYFFDNDEDILKDQNNFLLYVSKLLKKASTSHNKSIAKGGAGH